MNYRNILFTSVVLASLAVPADAAQVNESSQQVPAPITMRSSKPGWANVNRITLQDIYLPTNSGIMKITAGETITVRATVDYSGAFHPILQSSVLFENVDPALSIGYDPHSLIINQRTASFTFTVTLKQHLSKPALFTVKVADGLPSDNQYLTPYSQRQTVEEASSLPGNEDLVEVPETDGGITENKPTVKPEKPDQEVPTTPEEPDQEVPTTPEEPDQEVPTTPEEPDQEVPTTPEEPDQEVPTTPEEPDQEVPTTPEKPDQEVPTTPEEPDQEVPTTPEEPDQEVPTTPEEPDQEVPTTPEEPDQEVPTTPEEPDQEVPTTPEEPDQEVPTTPEEPDQEVPTTPEKPDQEVPTTPEELKQEITTSKEKNDVSTKTNGLKQPENHEKKTLKNTDRSEKALANAELAERSVILDAKNEKNKDNNNENYGKNMKSVSLDTQPTLPKTAEKKSIYFMPAGLVLIGYTLLKLRRR